MNLRYGIKINAAVKINKINESESYKKIRKDGKTRKREKQNFLLFKQT